LNRVLPAEIRVIAWAPVRPDFSARFDCIEREYKYFFPKGDLDLEVSGVFFNSLSLVATKIISMVSGNINS
jgi:tRNA pseudouridine(38-40) synthase